LLTESLNWFQIQKLKLLLRYTAPEMFFGFMPMPEDSLNFADGNRMWVLMKGSQGQSTISTITQWDLRALWRGSQVGIGRNE
jgi:hypothetical protein